MRRGPWLAIGAVAVACGAHPPLPAVVPRQGPVEASVGSVRVITTHRATDGHVAAGLFVRTREGSAALRATAVLVIEARGEGAWRVRATPDGIAIRMSSETSELDATLRSLARALEVRDASAAEVEAALEHVRRRRAARANDETALATVLAIEALGGASIDLFGTADDDAEVTSSAVGAWLAEVLGAERTLVAIVGDVEETTLHAAIHDAFSSAPHVADAPEGTAAWQHGAARVAIGSHPIAAAATSVTSLDEAARIADWIERLAPGAHAASFPLRGRGVVSATLAGDEGALRSLATAFRDARTLDDEATRPEARDAESELLAIGDAWLARLTTAEIDDGLGLALVRASEGDAAPTTDETLDALTVTHSATPTTLDDRHAEARLESGLSIRVARSEGDAMAVAVSWAAGARFDPPREHGRAALLGRVLARGCEPDADASWVSDATLGSVILGETASIERTALRAIECVRHAATEVAHTEGVRATAIAEIDLGARVRAWAASLLAPGAPGLVAPGGSAVGLAAATQLDDALDDALDPRRATIAIVANESPERLLAIAEALGGVLRAGTAPLPGAPGEIPEGPVEAFETDADLDVPIAVVALRSGAGSSERGARFVAHALADGLAARGLPVRTFEGRAARNASFAIVAVTGTDERLDALPARARAALAPVTLDESLARADADDADARALGRAAPAVLARSLVDDRTPDSAADVARALLRAPLHFVLARPTAPPLRRTR